MTRPDGNRHWVGNTVLALVWPPALARAAAGAPWWWCAWVGGISLGMMMGECFAAMTIPGWEPFRDIPEYVNVAMFGGSLVGAMIGVPIGSVFCAVAGWFTRVWKRSGKHELAANMRAWMLTPVCGVVPLLLWGGAALIAAARSSGFGLIYSTKPGWIEWHVFTVAAWGLSPPVVALLLIAVGSMSAATAMRLAPGACSCVGCGYDLAGLTGAVCPECGGALPHRKGAAA